VRLSPLDRLVAWSAALVAPPLTGTTLVKRVTATAPRAGAEETREPEAGRDRAAALAAYTEERVRLVAHFARAPRRLGLPPVPGWRDTCLSRAYAATLALRSRGIPASLAFGVRPDDQSSQGVAAHAWVILAGRALVDRTAPQFAELTQPAGARGTRISR
jgi:hypothetical protein